MTWIHRKTVGVLSRSSTKLVSLVGEETQPPRSRTKIHPVSGIRDATLYCTLDTSIIIRDVVVDSGVTVFGFEDNIPFVGNGQRVQRILLQNDSYQREKTSITEIYPQLETNQGN